VSQLFNLADNPHELLKEHHAREVVALTGAKPGANQTNLATNPKYAGKLNEMEGLLLAEMRRLDDPFRLWNQPQEVEPVITRNPVKKDKKKKKAKNN
jgi:hypothetical protein